MPSPAVRVKRERLVWSKTLSSETRDRPINLERARGSNDTTNDSPNDIPNPAFGSEGEQDSMEAELTRLVEMQENEDAMDVVSPSS